MNLTMSFTPARGSLNLVELTSRLRRWNVRRHEIARVRVELDSYTDRQLVDLGISRSDIPAVAAGEWRRA